MTSINDSITAIHSAYCEATGYEIAMAPAFERWWYNSLEWGVTPDDVRLVVKTRRDGIRKGERRENCLMIRNFAGSDEEIANVINEAAAIRANMRVKVFDKGKAEVLRSTGRESAPRPADSKHISEIFGEMKKAANL